MLQVVMNMFFPLLSRGPYCNVCHVFPKIGIRDTPNSKTLVFCNQPFLLILNTTQRNHGLVGDLHIFGLIEWLC
jgi:hypothetical protein